MIVDDSLYCLTTHIIVHDSFLVSDFPRKSASLFKMTAKSFTRGSAAASEIHVYIQDDNHDKKIMKTKITKRRYLPKKG